MTGRRAHVPPLYAPGGARLDSIDIALLRLLKADARMENQVLAGKVGLSASACSTRVRRLEESGVIRGYIAVAEESVFESWSMLWVQVKLRQGAQKHRAAFEQALRDCPEVMEANEVAAPFSYRLKVALPTASEWAALRARIDPEDTSIESVDVVVDIRTVKRKSPHPILASGEPPQRD